MSSIINKKSSSSMFSAEKIAEAHKKMVRDADINKEYIDSKKNVNINIPDRIAYSPQCFVRELDKRHIDPWNIGQWKDYEYCQGQYRRLYALDPNIPRKELVYLEKIVAEINSPYSKDKINVGQKFILVYKLPILLERKLEYDSIIFYLYDTKSKITREYTVQYRETKPGEIEVINGYRTRNAMEDSFLQTGANIDKYNQGGMTHGSYYLQMDTPQYIPKPLNPHMYTYSDVPSNLAMENVGNIPERAGIFKASMFSN